MLGNLPAWDHPCLKVEKAAPPVRTMWKYAPRLPALFRVQTKLFAWLARNFPSLYIRMILPEFSETDRKDYARLKVADFFGPGRDEGYRQGGIGTRYDVMIPATWPIPLEEIRSKIYLWHGEEDISVPPAMGHYIAEKLPNCEATFIPDAGHFWIFEHMGDMLGTLVCRKSANSAPKFKRHTLGGLIMGSVGNSLIKGISPEEVSHKLESFYAYEELTAQFAKAAINRLAGQAEIFLKPPLTRKIEDAEGNAERLANRIARVGGAIPADPTLFVEVSPIESYSVPDPNDMGPFLGYALEQERIAIRFYSDFLEEIKDRDVITYFEVLEILKNHVDEEDEIENFIG